MRTDAVFFDFDGVLVDSVGVKGEAFATLYRDHGDDIVRQVKHYHEQNGGMSRFEKFKYFHQVFFGKILTAEESDVLDKRFSDLVVQSVIAANEIPGVSQLLNATLGRLPMHVISATPESELKNIIAKRNMSHYFSSVHGSPIKKDYHILSLINQHGYAKHKTWMIGDAINDYDAALSAGIQFLGYVASRQANPFPAGVKVISDMAILPTVIGLE